MNIVQATRAHYAALQHSRTSDRIPLGYAVIGHDDSLLTSGTVYVRASTESLRKGAQTRLERRLRAMYPAEAHVVRIVTRDVSRARMRTVR